MSNPAYTKEKFEPEMSQQAVNIPSSVIMASVAERKFLTKKRVISAIVTVLVTAFVVTGIIVGFWIFTQQNQMELQYKLNLINNDNSKANQDVSTNQAENLVQYHVKNADAEWWIVEDFNRNIKVTKVHNSDGVFKCLVTSLDEATSMPSNIQAPSSQDQKAEDAVTSTEMMTIAADPVKDSSFLGKTATNLCSGTPVYWTYKTCFNTTSDTPVRTKRSIVASTVKPTTVKPTTVRPSTVKLSTVAPKTTTVPSQACAPCKCGLKVCLRCGTIYYTYWLDVYGTWHCNWNIYYCVGYGYTVNTCIA